MPVGSEAPPFPGFSPDFRGSPVTSDGGLLAGDENLIGLMAVNRELMAQADASNETERVVLDMDSTESPVHGQQEDSAYNGHYEPVCYHPLLLFNQHGDCLSAKLRPGNASGAEDWDELLLPEIERQQAAAKQVAAAGAAAEDQELVANELAASADEDRRAARQARPVLRAVAG